MIKILTKFFHSSYQKNLSKIPNTRYFHIVDKDSPIWDSQMPKPENIFGISLEEALSRQEEFSLMLIGRHPEILKANEEGFQKMPKIFLEQTCPYNQWNIDAWRENREKYIDYTIFITKANMQAWGMKEDDKNSVIYHAINVDEFPKYEGGEKFVMTTCNEFPNRDWCCGYLLWVNSTWGLEDVRVYGYGNENIGEACKGAKSNDEIKKLLVKTGVYFNPSLASPLPMSILETLAVGTPIVSTYNYEMKNILQDGINSLVANDAITLRKKIIELLENPEKAKKLGERGKVLIKNMFTPERFIYKWSKIFEKVIK
jgi:hypothetical protein